MLLTYYGLVNKYAVIMSGKVSNKSLANVAPIIEIIYFPCIFGGFVGLDSPAGGAGSSFGFGLSSVIPAGPSGGGTGPSCGGWGRGSSPPVAGVLFSPT